MELTSKALTAFMAEQATVEHLEEYFGLKDWPGFTGRHFQALEGGGDGAEVADRITAADILAVGTLSVRIKPKRAVELIHGDTGTQLSELLREIEPDMDLVEDTAGGAIAPGSPADQAWKLLVAQSGINWVTAGKLLARKRPRLLPVYDTVVRTELGRPKKFWSSLRTALRDDNRALHRCAVDVRDRIGLTDREASVLRVIDVAIWMRGTQPPRVSMTS